MSWEEARSCPEHRWKAGPLSHTPPGDTDFAEAAMRGSDGVASSACLAAYRTPDRGAHGADTTGPADPQIPRSRAPVSIWASCSPGYGLTQTVAGQMVILRQP